MKPDFIPDHGSEIAKAMEPLEECPVCGEKPKTRTSFKPPQGSLHRSTRKTQYCGCGWSKIIPTYREAIIELGLEDEFYN